MIGLVRFCHLGDGVVLLQRFSLSLRRNLVGCQLEKQKVIPL